jgi:IclR family transcriptional regulator, KDG regulon repressor
LEEAITTVPAVRDKRTSIDKAMSLLNAFQDDALIGVGLSELARRASLPKSTAFRLLGMLQRNEAIERAGNDYRLGPMLQGLSVTRDSALHARMRDVLTPYLADLYGLTKQTVHLAVLRGTDVIYLNKLYGHLPVRSPSRIGGRAPAYCTAVGKVLLAHNLETAEKVLALGLPRWTPATITDPETLMTELARIRQTNLAYDREEILRGLTCIAAPILAPNGRAVAALSVSGPVSRFSPDAQAGILRKVCFEASRATAGFASRDPQNLRVARLA